MEIYGLPLDSFRITRIEGIRHIKVGLLEFNSPRSIGYLTPDFKILVCADNWSYRDSLHFTDEEAEYLKLKWS